MTKIVRTLLRAISVIQNVSEIKFLKMFKTTRNIYNETVKYGDTFPVILKAFLRA